MISIAMELEHMAVHKVFEIVHLENSSSRGLCYAIGSPHTLHEEVGNTDQVTFSSKRFENLEKSFRYLVAVVTRRWSGGVTTSRPEVSLGIAEAGQ